MIAKEKMEDEGVEKFKWEKREVSVLFVNGLEMKGSIEDLDDEVIGVVCEGKEDVI